MAYDIPLFNLNFDEKEAKAAYETIKSGWISTGPKCAELEQMFVDMWKVKYAVSVTNCTDALHLCCLACGVGPGDEVLCPSLTFAASANCIRYAGATPVFCDIVGPDHINIDPEDVKKKITPKTKAIVVVHMAGYPAKMDEIMAIAKEHNLKVIEDACHGPLSEYKGKKLGTIGDCAAFSFFSNKNISTGEGGMFISNNEELANRARLMRSHGMTTMSYQRASGHATAYDIVELGYNFRLDDIRASIAIEQLKKLPGDLEKRILVRKRYVENLSKIKGVVVPFADCTEFTSNYIMPVVLTQGTKEDRDAIREKIHAAGIQTSVHYPAIHKFSIYKDYGAVLPQTEYVTDHEITLPMYAALTMEQVDFICETVNKAING
ncbi:DegT/DnrJ/EryC1/StrS family aminotransferase [Fibrobacter succinogenes]|uniref:dTDP-4-amino-4,6-dideoxygalactose transaminase n=1 Tax=Fibrobacter succinogenes TaxID=833 RepID=A0A380S7K3_FIBSU|nr:DegT/DnrJ/EryC1/StrS family aminotransferase [Fibrobacter succinogenes]PWJ34880.1 dTDP-4-amino-4,6-dideoxygalactose transaminase [Fibrobacter succinogenes subsp. elongatus]SUQ25003.1 dTDP-4-amino-4,6-dideoxygalactose transaminase [Fibrobacter succinogenes]